MKYLTVSADCTKESRDLLSVEWDEGELGEPTGEAVLKALGGQGRLRRGRRRRGRPLVLQ